MTTATREIVIIGSRIAANMAAACFRQQHPALNVTIVGRTDKHPPVVGESLTEYTSIFLRGIGMDDVLGTKHLPKFGLSFYFKEQLDNPASRRYAVHEATQVHAIPSFLINRFTFDEDLAELNRSRGVEFVDANVEDVELEKDGPHRLTLKDAAGNVSTITARWLVDATGRRRFLARKLGLHREPVHQRSTFWFRLANFDPGILRHIEAIRTWQPPFDSYHVAHHFLGKGNWIWCIPMQSLEHRSFISIGITYRPDLLQKITSMEEFLCQVDSEHPVLGELVRSGTVVDTNFYLNYMYETERLYSTDRWFMVGDSTDSSDPLFSTGLVMTAIQSTQVSELIRRDLNGGYSATLAHDLEMAYKTLRNNAQSDVSSLYEVIHDPYQSHWRVHIASAVYFFFMLPQVMSGYMVDPVGARWIRTAGTKESRNVRLLNELLARGSPRLGPQPSEAIRNLYDRSVNWELKDPKDEDIPRYLAHLLFLLAEFRFVLLRNAGWSGWSRHLPICLTDLGKALFLRVAFRGRSLKASPLIKKFVGL